MYDNDVFISYAHIDNLPLSDEQLGWISRFHNTLSVFLSQRLGNKARIWRDQKLRGNDIFGAEIVDQFRQTAIFVSILSPRYVRSEWCKREIKGFCRQAEEAGSLVVDNKSRVLKIVKTPVDAIDDLPDVIRDSLGYEFFLWEGQGPMELDPDFGERYKQDYLRKVCIVANDAAQLIRRVDASSPGTEATTVPPPRRTVVFLAACGFDQRDNREVIAADLRKHGYRVLPEDQLPVEDEDAHREALLPLLAQAPLSVHLIGASAGAIPDGPSHQPLVEMHNALAASRARAEGLRRLIWVPEDLRASQPQQRHFLTALLTDTNRQAGADLLRGSLEEFRTFMHTTLDALERPEPDPLGPDPVLASPAFTVASSRLIYLRCVEDDRGDTMALRKWLKSQGCDISLPAFDGEAAAIRRAHEHLLRDCLGVVVYYGAGDEAWHRSVSMELRRAPAYRDGRPLPPPLLYLAPPSNDDKADMVELEEPHLVDGREGFSPQLLLPFLEQINGPPLKP